MTCGCPIPPGPAAHRPSNPSRALTSQRPSNATRAPTSPSLIQPYAGTRPYCPPKRAPHGRPPALSILLSHDQHTRRLMTTYTPSDDQHVGSPQRANTSVRRGARCAATQTWTLPTTWRGTPRKVQRDSTQRHSLQTCDRQAPLATHRECLGSPTM
jgi:hypothetical protein